MDVKSAHYLETHNAQLINSMESSEYKTHQNKYTLSDNKQAYP